MATDMAEFLWHKFLNALRGLESEKSSEASLFSDIKSVIGEEYPKMKTCSSFASEICPLLYDLNDEIAELQIFAQQRTALNKNLMRVNFFTNIYFKQKMINRLKKIKEAFETVRNAEGEPSPPRSSPTAQRTVVEDNASENFGFEKYKEKIENLLQEESNQVGLKAIGISGMGGSGKTALAREIFNSPRVTSHFSKRIWVCLSDIRSVEQDVAMNIVKFILEEVGYDVDQLTTNLSMVELLKVLYDKLSSQRYLIVFDDVWMIPNSYANLGSRLPQETRVNGHFSQGLPKGCGGAVMVTSRLKEVARRMVGEKNLVDFQSLLNQKEACWNIFVSTLYKSATLTSVDDQEALTKCKHEISVDDQKALTKCKLEIMEKCHGLPLAAKMLARIISTKIRN